ncbi:phosphoesterase [Sulfodiicoccus acidiphilus]|uniref:Phosphoesterase n=1 Tax=Sulfodiicoccus acidiphilus TaxID=1670455 RepID=A0A348B4C4_9CREN|nr:phosphoesterase [Sulfodiicoccus acidiphilus]
MSYVAVVHNDLDGTCSAAVYARAVGELPSKVFFTEPTRVHKLLKEIRLEGLSEVTVADLGLNSSTVNDVVEAVRSITSAGVKVRWFDHHVWREEWARSLTEAGAEVHVDTSTCGAGVVLKGTSSQDEVSKRIVSADCAVDMWWHDDPLGEKLRRVVEASREYSWKEHMVRKFFEGKVWDEEFQRVLEEQVDLELRGYSVLHKYYRVITVNGVKVAIALRWKGRPDISYAAQYVMSRSGASIFVSANGKSISFRSSSYQVREYAVKFGEEGTHWPLEGSSGFLGLGGSSSR